jgi:hypothetical protein
MLVSPGHSTQTSVLRLFSFDAAISSLSRVWNSASTGGVLLTVSGLHFGLADSSASLAVGTEYLCYTTFWTSSSTVGCRQGQAGLAGTVPFIVSVGNLVSTATGALSFDAPLLSQMRPANMPHSSQRSCTLAGLNFGRTDSTSTLMVRNPDRLLCSTLSWTSMTINLCRLFPSLIGPADSMPIVTLTIANVVSTHVGLFSFDSPVLSLVHPRNMPFSGSAWLVAQGLNFALTEPTPTLTFRSSVLKRQWWHFSKKHALTVCFDCAGSGV